MRPPQHALLFGIGSRNVADRLWPKRLLPAMTVLMNTNTRIHPLVIGSSLFVACSLLVATGARAQGSGTKPSVAIIVTKAKGAPDLTANVKKQVESLLKKSVTVLPFPKLVAAAKKAELTKADVTTLASAASVGKAGGVSHLVYVESQIEPDAANPKKKAQFASVTLVDVATGNTVFTERYALKAARFAPDTPAPLVEKLVAAITAPPQPAEPPKPTEISEAPAPDASKADATAAGTSPAPAPTETGAAPGAAATTPTEATTPVANTTTAETSAAAPTAATGRDSESTAATSSGSEPTKNGSWRPAIRADVGYIFLQRDARIGIHGGGPIKYVWPLNGGYARGEVFPLALGGTGRWYEGIGVHAEGDFMYALTEKWGFSIQEGSKRKVKSGVGGGSAGLSLRLVFWNSETAPDLTLKGGYRIFVFPLKEGAFPGTRYSSAYVGGTVAVPIIPLLAITVGGRYFPGLKVSGRLVRLGHMESANAWDAEGGVRVSLAPFEILALGRFEQSVTKYTGGTNLDDSSKQYRDVRLQDRMYGGLLAVGCVF